MPDAKRVLIVDDDPSIRKLLAVVLRRRGLLADTAANGEQGLAQLRERRYAVVLLDLMMPLLDGQALAAALAEWPQETRPLVLVMTASDDAVLRELDKTVVAGIIRKPFDIFDVADIVRACADGPPHELAKDHAQASPLGRRGIWLRPGRGDT